MSESLFRVVDANVNRLKEGIRVVEDIFRFVFNNRDISTELKTIRHSATLSNYSTFLTFRNIQKDVLKKTLNIENSRENISDLVFANIKRAQESSRVLEEVFKLIDMHNSEKFKSIRYNLYNLELKIAENIHINIKTQKDNT